MNKIRKSKISFGNIEPRDNAFEPFIWGSYGSKQRLESESHLSTEMVERADNRRYGSSINLTNDVIDKLQESDSSEHNEEYSSLPSILKDYRGEYLTNMFEKGKHLVRPGIICAIQTSNMEALKSILKPCADEETVKKNGSNFLAVAAKNRNALDCAKYVLDFLQEKDDQNITQYLFQSMETAAKNDNFTYLDMLKEKLGRRMFYRAENGNSSSKGLNGREDFTDDASTEIDSDEKSVEDMLRNLVPDAKPNQVKYFLEAGETLGRFHHGALKSVLFQATEHGRQDLVEMLISYGVNINEQKDGEQPLHVAAKNGKDKVVKILLENGGHVDDKNNLGETALHLAAKYPDSKSVQMLLEKGAKVTTQDKKLCSPVHHCVSRESGQNDTEAGKCLKQLLKKGKESVLGLADEKGNTALHTAAIFKNINMVSLLIENNACLLATNDKNQSSFYLVNKYVPDGITAILQRMDKCVKFEDSIRGEDLEISKISLMFEPIAPKNKGRNNSESVSEISVFKDVLKIHLENPFLAEKVLMHPLSQCYLQMKWSEIKWLYTLRLIMHFTFSVTYSVYAVLVYKNLCPPDRKLFSTWQNIECAMPSVGSLALKVAFARSSWVLLILFDIFYLLKEISKIVHLKFGYFLSLDSYINLFLVGSVPCILMHDSSPFGTQFTVAVWQYHVAAFGVFFVWVMQMLLIGKTPRFGKYVNMFKSVIWTFANFFFAYVFIFIAFAVSFYILFPEHPAFKEVFPAAMVKVIVMMLGELEYEDLYYPKDEKFNFTLLPNMSNITGDIEEIDKGQFFKGTAHFLVLLFILLVSMIIMNLLFGLAVNDIQKLYKKAHLNRLIQQVQLIEYLEDVFVRKTPFCCKKFIHIIRSRITLTAEVHDFKSIDLKMGKESKLPKRLRKELYAHCQRERERRGKKSNLETKVDDIYNHLNISTADMETKVKNTTLEAKVDHLNLRLDNLAQNLEMFSRMLQNQCKCNSPRYFDLKDSTISKSFPCLSNIDEES